MDIGKSVDVASSDFVDSVGTGGKLQNVVSTEDGKKFFMTCKVFSTWHCVIKA